MKFLQFAILFSAVFAFAYAVESTWGRRVSGDFLLMSELVRRNGLAGTYSSVEVQFPRSGLTNNRNISAIYVYDKYTNGRGAIANLWSGGPGFKFATINVKSQYGQGINSTVEIYGR